MGSSLASLSQVHVRPSWHTGSCNETKLERVLESVKARLKRSSSRAARSHGPQYPRAAFDLAGLTSVKLFIMLSLSAVPRSLAFFPSTVCCIVHRDTEVVVLPLFNAYVIHSFRFTTMAEQYGCHKDRFSTSRPLTLEWTHLATRVTHRILTDLTR